MKDFIHSFKFKIIICIFALLIGFMIYAAAAGVASLPEQAARTVTTPFARLSTTISSFVEGNLDKIVNADKYKRENEELRELIAELNRQNVNIDELNNDNRLLREMLEISEDNPDFEWPDNICTISSWNANDVFRGFTINRGETDGIITNSLVITKTGVVGRISSVSPYYSKVSTVFSTETEIGVLTPRGNVQGVLQNDIEYARKGLCRVSYIEIDADIREGDLVVTLGTDMYPANQVIGEVTEVYDDPNGMSKHALVKPAENITKLTNVLVITNFEGKEIIDE